MFTNLGPVDDDRAVLLRLTVAQGRAEVVADRLFEVGATSIEESLPGALVAGFGNRAAALAALTALGPLEQASALVEVPDDTWFDGWRAYARAAKAGKRLVVCPTWIDYDPLPGELVITIEPGRSFGSGAHPTTRMVLAALETTIDNGAWRVADVGSGSGVLSVAAGLLGATRVVATDIDPQARAATAANLRRCGVRADVGGHLPDEEFDVIVANIGARALIQLAASLTNRTKRLILAGFLTPGAAAVLAAYPGWCITSRAQEANWTCLVLEDRGN